LQTQLYKLLNNIQVQQETLTEAQLTKIEPVLKDELQLISKTMESVKSLSLEIEI
jgi:hypothetical protein